MRFLLVERMDRCAQQRMANLNPRQWWQLSSAIWSLPVANVGAFVVCKVAVSRAKHWSHDLPGGLRRVYENWRIQRRSVRVACWHNAVTTPEIFVPSIRSRITDYFDNLELVLSAAALAGSHMQLGPRTRTNLHQLAEAAAF